MKQILDKTKTHFEQNLPFVVYRKPNEATVISVFQKNDILHEVNTFDEKGFIFCSFDGNATILIPENQSEILISKIDFEDNIIKNKSLDFEDKKARADFENLVVKGIKAIQRNQFQKVVLSRKETIESLDFDLVIFLNKVIKNYSNAFCYCFFHPKVGLWFGATPEQLLQVSGSKFTTVALAGTLKNIEETTLIWQEKEKQEQEFVTSYIAKNLKNIASKIEISEPQTVKAGNLLHLKTTISGVLNTDFDLKNCIQILQPTPAVCGLPKDEAKQFILENENYDRQFYTGFLGELNLANKTNLFVNLRCMQIHNNNAVLYMGCGITKDSVPEKEWQESINKSATMKNLLD